MFCPGHWKSVGWELDPPQAYCPFRSFRGDKICPVLNQGSATEEGNIPWCLAL